MPKRGVTRNQQLRLIGAGLFYKALAVLFCAWVWAWVIHKIGG